MSFKIFSLFVWWLVIKRRMRISFFSSDGTLNKVDRSHTILVSKGKNPVAFFFFFLVSHVLPIWGECGLMV